MTLIDLHLFSETTPKLKKVAALISMAMLLPFSAFAEAGDKPTPPQAAAEIAEQQDTLPIKDGGNTKTRTVKMGNPIEFSTAGFFTVKPEQRAAYNFNVGWRFQLGDIEGAEKDGFDDSAWPTVNLPHGLELLPLSASGSCNYQGVAWYRKHFVPQAEIEGRRIFLHFEGIMGKSSLWVNGHKVGDFFGGYLPIHIDVTDLIRYGASNQVAVRADNRDDPLYPPGKPQRFLDFTYFGGMYRDVWLIATHDIHITNANAVDQVAGGGVFLHTRSLNSQEAILDVSLDLANHRRQPVDLELTLVLKDHQGKAVARTETRVTGAGKSAQAQAELRVDSPRAWHVDDPYLYHLFVEVRANSQLVDCLRQRVGLRTIELDARRGLILNGNPIEGKLIGGNRHQDFAYLGNAVPNSLQWRDAQKMRQAAMRVVRAAHYPLDPAFMDACDQLGLLVIVATPGWQFWNEEPVFEQRVLKDIANMVRRDRNHPSVLMWEPILNETRYPDAFARKAHDAVHREYPYAGCYTACDAHARGQEHFDVVYSHPFESAFWSHSFEDTEENWEKFGIDYQKLNRPVFTREFGDSVDNWSAQNSPSRVAKSWGELPQVVQSLHYAAPDYLFTSWDSLYRTPDQHFGGTLWHTFDHQRGYHPDPFWGGILDATRQPKYSYHMFRSQMPVGGDLPYVDTKPYLFIAHEMHPASMQDVVIFSNCEQVRVWVLGEEKGTYSMRSERGGMPHPPLVLEDTFDLMRLKEMRRDRELSDDAVIRVEGMIDGNVVATEVKEVINRPSQLELTLDDVGLPLIADGSDVVAVVARVTDGKGNLKRFNTGGVRFSVSGAGELVEAPGLMMNPQPFRWGEAVALVRAGHEPGSITVRASLVADGGVNPAEANLKLNSLQSPLPLLFSEVPRATSGNHPSDRALRPESEAVEALKRRLRETEEALDAYKRREVERQQEQFEGGGAE